MHLEPPPPPPAIPVIVVHAGFGVMSRVINSRHALRIYTYSFLVLTVILETGAVEERRTLVQLKLMQNFPSKILAHAIMCNYNIIRNIVIAHEFTMRL